MTETEDLYLVVRNHEDQYSIWAAGREIPAGWESLGEPATRTDCLDGSPSCGRTCARPVCEP